MSRARDLGSLINSTAAGKNLVINGGFDIWQRGASISFTNAAGYVADRWYISGSQTYTMSQQTSGSPEGCSSHARVSYGAANSFGNIFSPLESSVVKSLWGKTITLSFKARRSSGYVNGLVIGIQTGTVADSLQTGTWVEAANNLISNANLPTGTSFSDWQSSSFSFFVPVGTLGLRVRIGEQTTQPSGAYYEVSAVQLEVGSSATPFSRAGGDIQGELAKCQRYYYRSISESLYGPIGTGKAYATNILNINVPLPVKMRSIPSVTAGDLSALSTFQFETGSSAGTTPTSIAVNPNLNSSTYGSVDVVKTSAFTTGAFYYLMGSNSTNSFIGFSAEL